MARDGAAKTFEVTVVRQPGEETANEADEHKGKWGLALRELRPEERQERGLEGKKGVLVTGVAPDSPAAEAGIEAGDLLARGEPHAGHQRRAGEEGGRGHPGREGAPAPRPCRRRQQPLRGAARSLTQPAVILPRCNPGGGSSEPPPG